ncbi:FYVE-type zinc finger-containing protein [Cavenderia fasciculata]|uniref:FYVE-type zinc finger-containing protein n=1 Tax=Cavenderia fasciculata TaxID=261658 RepID=F4PH80_CACFS|nr:FYVE-type zinc finger-containing protein [Cavenderia fasciculata]EGG25064.1 FYVE-type zinc finger-containing protein [Cavenderia fasciculata]|eukprot:XP_004362915.1 FYVE-type zinc finger-containing protein [Cavenderia fasciculata]
MSFHVTVKGDPALAAGLSNDMMGGMGAMGSMVHDMGHMMHDATKMAVKVAHAVSDITFIPIDTRNKIWVTLNQPSYVGGDIVAGTVEMDCIVPFFAKGVLIKFKGFERVFLQEHRTETEGTGNDKRTVHKTIDHKENKEFFKSTICVYPHQGSVNPGHYSFPFSYQLPPTLPGTFCEEGKDAMGAYAAKILYKVKATVDVAHKHDLKFTTKLVVNERCGDLVKPSYGENRKSFLLTKGKLVVKCWLNKNAYFPGETLVSKIKANNTSTKQTRKVSIKVHHRMELRAHLYHRTITHTVHKQEYPGFQPCFYGKRYLPFFIPVDLKPSSSLGDHVKSSYIISVEFDLPGAIDLSVDLPLTLYAPQFLYSAIPSQPPGAPLPPDVAYRHPWENDDNVNHCNKCKCNFSLFNRKHHCRHCMKIFCSKCTEKATPITKLAYPKPVKVCDECYPIASQGGVKYQSAKQMLASYQEALRAYYAQYIAVYPWMAEQQALLPQAPPPPQYSSGEPSAPPPPQYAA